MRYRKGPMWPTSVHKPHGVTIYGVIIAGYMLAERMIFQAKVPRTFFHAMWYIFSFSYKFSYTSLNQIILLVLRQESYWRTRLRPLLQLPWFISSLGDQQSCYLLCWLDAFLVFTGNQDVNLVVEKWYKTANILSRFIKTLHYVMGWCSTIFWCFFRKY